MADVFTIGHSNHDAQRFLDLLIKHSVQVLVDVRSAPYSRHAPQFNRADIEHLVRAAGIEYRYSGAGIGGKPKDPDLYTPAGVPDYDALAKTPRFQEELTAVSALAAETRVAIMCSEANPMSCHRERIIAPILRSWGLRVLHIMPDGSAAEIEQQALF